MIYRLSCPRRCPSHIAVPPRFLGHLVHPVFQRLACGCIPQDTEHGHHGRKHITLCVIGGGSCSLTAAYRYNGERLVLHFLGAVERGWGVGCTYGSEKVGHGMEEGKEREEAVR